LKSWTYRLKLARPSIPEGSKAVLAFDGLDTFAHVKLNGKTILQSDNMFLPHRVDITEAVQSNSHHDLEIEFDSAFLRAREIKDRHPEHKFICFNGDPGRLAVRKAQYHWGWDWGPVLMCAGIWRPIRLEVFAVRVADIRTDITIQDDYKLATVRASAHFEGVEGLSHHAQAKFTVCLNNKELTHSHAEVTPDGKAFAELKIPDPELWWPNGYGEQPLYHVSVTVSAAGTILHTESRRIGLRKIELVQKPDRHGKSFYFRVNDVDIFCGGSCWIPTDSFLTNVTPEKYRAWIELMVPANQKMIR
jgi:beta-mannosidase